MLVLPARIFYPWRGVGVQERCTDGPPYDLSEDQFRLIENLLLKRGFGGPLNDPRTVMNGTFWVLSAGMPWRDMPEWYGEWQPVYHRFNSWRKAGGFRPDTGARRPGDHPYRSDQESQMRDVFYSLSQSHPLPFFRSSDGFSRNRPRWTQTCNLTGIPRG
ncbi:MAG: transposase [Deltaproteobacteria bacterium]|nr:transposase [Deltaproteobacteria bacterium]